MKTHTQKQIEYIKSISCLSLANDLQDLEGITRSRIGRDFGTNEGINKYPISGGICDHWPECKKREMLEVVHAKQEALEDSLSHWRASGKQARTWRNLKG